MVTMATNPEEEDVTNAVSMVSSSVNTPATSAIGDMDGKAPPPPQGLLLLLLLLHFFTF